MPANYGKIGSIAVSRALGALRVVVPRRELEKDPVLFRVLERAEV